MSALVNQIMKIFDLGEPTDEFGTDYDDFTEELETEETQPVSTKRKDLGVVLIPSKNELGFKSFNLVETEDGIMKAVRDDELEIIQQSIEE